MHLGIYLLLLLTYYVVLLLILLNSTNLSTVDGRQKSCLISIGIGKDGEADTLESLLLLLYLLSPWSSSVNAPVAELSVDQKETQL